MHETRWGPCPFGVPLWVLWYRITKCRCKERKALITVEILAGGNETGYKEKKNTKTSKENSSTIDDKCVAIISAVEAERVMPSASSVRLPANTYLCCVSGACPAGLVWFLLICAVYRLQPVLLEGISPPHWVIIQILCGSTKIKMNTGLKQIQGPEKMRVAWRDNLI